VVMKVCKVTITTVADGRENTITRKGEMDVSSVGGILRYQEENAKVNVRLQGNSATIERFGDYTLFLPLEQNVFCDGEIGIGGSGGTVKTYAHKIAYAVTKDSLLLSLHYDLIISGEVQKIRLRLLARYEED